MIVTASRRQGVEDEEILTLIPCHPVKMRKVARRKRRKGRTKLVLGPFRRAGVPSPVEENRTVTRSTRGGGTLRQCRHPRLGGDSPPP